MASCTITPNIFGLIVRGKHKEKHHPGKPDQHADCILPESEPVGYFGGGVASSGSGDSGFARSLKS